MEQSPVSFSSLLAANIRSILLSLFLFSGFPGGLFAMLLFTIFASGGPSWPVMIIFLMLSAYSAFSIKNGLALVRLKLGFVSCTVLSIEIIFFILAMAAMFFVLSHAILRAM